MRLMPQCAQPLRNLHQESPIAGCGTEKARTRCDKFKAPADLEEGITNSSAGISFTSFPRQAGMQNTALLRHRREMAEMSSDAAVLMMMIWEFSASRC